MYYNYNVPNYRGNMPRNGFGLNKNNDRFIGGGFIAPFLLGGITGSILSRPNGNFYGPYPAPFPAPYPVPVPYYTNTSYPTYSENYYYY